MPQTNRFLPQGAFFTELKTEVDDHLRRFPPRRAALARKMAFIATWWVVSWVVLVFVVDAWWQAALAAISLGLAMAGIGFNVQHDGGHLAVSPHRTLNRLAAFGLDLLGGSSWIWHWKHNVFHHTPTSSASMSTSTFSPSCASRRSNACAPGIAGNTSTRGSSTRCSP